MGILKLNYFVLWLMAIFLGSGCSLIQKNDMRQANDIKSVEMSFDPPVQFGTGSLEEKSYLASQYFLQGNDASMRGDFKTAKALFQKAHDLRPQDSYIKKKLAYELIRVSELDAAEKLLVEIFYDENEKKDEMIGLVLASVYTSLEKEKDAREIYKKILADNPSSEEACLYFARSLVTDKQHNEAHKLLKNCDEKADGNPAFSFFRGKIEYDRGAKKNARKFFLTALKLDPEYEQAALGIGALFEEAEDFDSAIKVYKEFLSFPENENQKAVLSRIVSVLFALERHKEVLPYVESLSLLDEEDLNLKVRLGLLYTGEERFKDAIDIFKAVLVQVPDSDKVLYYLGALYQQINQPKECVKYFEKVPETSPLYGDAGVQVSQVLANFAKEEYTKGKIDSVLKFNTYIENRLAKNPDMLLELRMVQANFYEDIFKFTDAISTILPIANHKNFTDGHRYYLASLYEKDGQFLEARAIVSKIIEKDPNNAHALNFLGYSYLEKSERMDLAFEYISRALLLKPDDGYIQDSMAWYYYQNGKFEIAKKHAEKALELVKEDVVISKHLGMIYQELHLFDKAKEIYSRALESAVAQTDREDVLKLIKSLETNSTRMPASLNP